MKPGQLEQVSLDYLLQCQPLGLSGAQLRSLARGLCDALRQFHICRAAHLRLSPATVWLTEDGAVCLSSAGCRGAATPDTSRRPPVSDPHSGGDRSATPPAPPPPPSRAPPAAGGCPDWALRDRGSGGSGSSGGSGGSCGSSDCGVGGCAGGGGGGGGSCDSSNRGGCGGCGPPAWWYAAPEQALGLEAGPPADVFALGLLLAEAATGAPLLPSAPCPRDRLRRAARLLGPPPPHTTIAAAVAAARAAAPRPGLRPQARAAVVAESTAPATASFAGAAACAGFAGWQPSAPCSASERVVLQRLAAAGLGQGYGNGDGDGGGALAGLIDACLAMDPAQRPTVDELLRLPYLAEQHADGTAAVARVAAAPPLQPPRQSSAASAPVAYVGRELPVELGPGGGAALSVLRMDPRVGSAADMPHVQYASTSATQAAAGSQAGPGAGRHIGAPSLGPNPPDPSSSPLLPLEGSSGLFGSPRAAAAPARSAAAALDAVLESGSCSSHTSGARGRLSVDASAHRGQAESCSSRLASVRGRLSVDISARRAPAAVKSAIAWGGATGEAALSSRPPPSQHPHPHPHPHPRPHSYSQQQQCVQSLELPMPRIVALDGPCTAGLQGLRRAVTYGVEGGAGGPAARGVLPGEAAGWGTLAVAHTAPVQDPRPDGPCSTGPPPAPHTLAPAPHSQPSLAAGSSSRPPSAARLAASRSRLSLLPSRLVLPPEADMAAGAPSAAAAVATVSPACAPRSSSSVSGAGGASAVPPHPSDRRAGWLCPPETLPPSAPATCTGAAARGQATHGSLPHRSKSELAVPPEAWQGGGADSVGAVATERGQRSSSAVADLPLHRDSWGPQPPRLLPGTGRPSHDSRHSPTEALGRCSPRPTTAAYSRRRIECGGEGSDGPLPRLFTVLQRELIAQTATSAGGSPQRMHSRTQQQLQQQMQQQWSEGGGAPGAGCAGGGSPAGPGGREAGENALYGRRQPAVLADGGGGGTGGGAAALPALTRGSQPRPAAAAGGEALGLGAVAEESASLALPMLVSAHVLEQEARDAGGRESGGALVGEIETGSAVRPSGGGRGDTARPSDVGSRRRLGGALLRYLTTDGAEGSPAARPSGDGDGGGRTAEAPAAARRAATSPVEEGGGAGWVAALSRALRLPRRKRSQRVAP